FLCTCGRAQTLDVFRFEHEGKTHDLVGIMKATNTPGLSLAIDYGSGDTTFTQTVAGANISATALFPVGAASSAPMLAAILQLVERGQIDLDAPINNYLTRLQLPANKGKAITTRELLLFKVKFNVGYKPEGYEAGAPYPTLLDLAKQLVPKGTRGPEANSNYGQWLPLQLLLEDSYGEDLQTIVAREVLLPLGIKDMYYQTELTPNQLARAAKGHKENGKPWPGDYQRYVTTGNHGLWSTPLAYVRFIRALLDIWQGKEGSILQPATVKEAMTTTYGHRSLLFHLGNGQPYWGGNAKGYYFQMQANLEENWVAAVAVNRQLNWRLGGPVLGQAGLLVKQWRSEDQLGIILQAGEENDPTVAAIEHYAFYTGIRSQRIMATEGVPAEITATPAYVYQGPKGRAIYSGRHDQQAGIERFIRASRVAPKQPATDTRMGELSLRRGRQAVVLPLKLTTPTGTEAPAVLPAALKESFLRELSTVTGFTSTPNTALTALDRRIYLDVHPYRTPTGDYQFTYAIFSQFNCHTPVFTSFGNPVVSSTNGDGLKQLAQNIARDLGEVLDATAGYVPTAVPGSIPEQSWKALGWSLDPAIIAAQEVEEIATPVTISGNYQVQLTEQDAPGLFFSFPAPLDRYSGEIQALTASFRFSPQGQRVSGEVNLPVAAISTGSGSLDTYVLGDILKQRKYPTASLSFTEIDCPSPWQVGITQQLDIPAELSVRGKTYPVIVQASFTPNAAGQLDIEAAFRLDFKKVFNNDGPDGPADKRRQLDFQAKLLVMPTDSAR
ncbi:MAG: serine hydrolase domain-containing protein, partial [Bacteroidota bacterium]